MDLETNAVAPRDEIEKFLRLTNFSGYQAVGLPHGCRVPGTDRSATANMVFPASLEGCSVLDVGCYYGAFLVEAALRGASRVVGVEADPDRFAVAEAISQLWGSRYEVHHGYAHEVELGERFDIVLFLNVLHHLDDPVAAVKAIASHCRGTLVLEFCLADDPENLRYLSDADDDKSPGVVQRIGARVRSLVLRSTMRGLPVMMIGRREYHRTFYFSPQALENLFMVHHPIFSEMTFARSPGRQRRMLAFCRVK